MIIYNCPKETEDNNPKREKGELMEDMESKTVARLIEWLKKHGHTDSEIVECIEFITTGKERAD